MAKIKVHELAKELELQSKDILNFLMAFFYIFLSKGTFSSDYGTQKSNKHSVGFSTSLLTL